jgi:hypothetical protein
MINQILPSKTKELCSFAVIKLSLKTMFIIDPPYVSELLRDTLLTHQFPVLDLPDSRRLLPAEGINFVRPEQAQEMIRGGEITTIYTSSENSIGWINQNLSFTSLPDKVAAFKDKALFRDLTRALNPNLFYRKVSLQELAQLRFAELPHPFIIKPNTGFFSLGVYKGTTAEDLEIIKKQIIDDVARVRDTYPTSVLDMNSFLIEEIIEGDEYTVDAFYDADGKPMILGMMHHHFADATDTSDRLYVTSAEIINTNYDRFLDFLERLGKIIGLQNFPLHLEVRIDSGGTILPIEGNPLRYGGWCTSAELTHYAFGFNPYLLFMKQQKPDWPWIIAKNSGDLFSIIVLNNNTGWPAAEIDGFDYEKLLSRLQKPLELRRVDVNQFHVFGFVYVQTAPGNFAELDSLLKSNLREFVLKK